MKKLFYARKCSRKSWLKKALSARNRRAASSHWISYGKNGGKQMISKGKIVQAFLKTKGGEWLSPPQHHSVHSHVPVLTQMSEKNMEKLRRLGFKINVLGSTTEGKNPFIHLIKVVRGTVAPTSVVKLEVLASQSRKPSTSRSHPSTRHHISRGGGGGFFGDFDGGFAPSIGGGGGGGGDDPHNHGEEEKLLLVTILLNDGKARKQLYEVLKILDQREGAIRKRLNQLSHEDDMAASMRKPEPKMLFHENIDEDELAAALLEVYDKMIGNSAQRKGAIADFKPAELMAYLFMVIALHHYGHYEFEKNGKKPFYEFFIDKVTPDLYGKRGVTRKTMSNYVKPLAEWMLLSDEDKAKLPKPVQNINKGIEKKYNLVCGNFHNTAYGKKLAKQEWK